VGGLLELQGKGRGCNRTQLTSFIGSEQLSLLRIKLMAAF